MNKWMEAAIKRKKALDTANNKAKYLDFIVTEIMKIPYDQLKNVLPDTVMEVLKKCGYTE